jgi:hypothetical protein
METHLQLFDKGQSLWDKPILRQRMLLTEFGSRFYSGRVFLCNYCNKLP